MKQGLERKEAGAMYLEQRGEQISVTKGQWGSIRKQGDAAPGGGVDAGEPNTLQGRVVPAGAVEWVLPRSHSDVMIQGKEIKQ